MRISATHRRAALLLEIIVALTIMVSAMAFVGAQLIGGLRMVAYADQQARAGELADRMLAILELDTEATVKPKRHKPICYSSWRQKNSRSYRTGQGPYSARGGGRGSRQKCRQL